MCLDSINQEAVLPKKLVAWKQFKDQDGRGAGGKKIFTGRYHGGSYVIGKTYTAPPDRISLGSFRGSYAAGFHAYEAQYEPDWKPTNVVWRRVLLTGITAKGEQNGQTVYVARQMRILYGKEKA